jgi:cytochrome b561
MTRETKGIIGFVALTLVVITVLCMAFGFKVAPIAIGGVLVIAAMIAREVWQFKTGQASHFEWEDVVEYGIFIAMTTAIYFLIVAIFKEL